MSKLILYLNHCELVATSIAQGAMDEQTYKLYQRTPYVQTWKFAKEHIMERRITSGQTTLYENFQNLAEQWDNES